MGWQANTLQIRNCKCCGDDIYATAKELQEHEKMCKLAKGVGLILATNVVVK